MAWSRTTAVRALAGATLVGAAVAAVLLVPNDLGELGRVADAAGPWATLAFVAAWVLGTSVLLSGTALSVLGGVLFGPVGVLLSLLASPAGALVAFLIARFLARDALTARMPRRAADLATRLERSGARGIATVRLMPAVPSGAFNYACGLTRIGARDFFVGTALGAAPRVILYGLAGGAIARVGLLAPLAVSVAMGLVALAVVAWRRHAGSPTAATVSAGG